MSFSIEIKFQKSRSKYYSDVIRHAKKFFNFQKGDTNVLRIETIEELFGRWDDFSVVVWGATKWSGTNIYYCNRPLIPYSNDFYYKLQDVKICYNNYLSDITRLWHCAESDWGCRMLKEINLHSYPSSLNWYDFGRFIDENTWTINKDLLLRSFKNEIEMKMINICPALKWAEIEKIINSLPDNIIVDKKHWDFRYRLEHRQNGYHNVPKGVIPIEQIESPDKDELTIKGLSKIDISELTEDEINKLIEIFRKKSND